MTIILLMLVSAVVGMTIVVLARYVWVRLRGTEDAIERVAEEAVVTVEGHEARAIDPGNPPHWVIWKGIDGRINCTCHALPIRKGQKILMWPIPGHPDGGMDLFCERIVKEAKGE